MTGEDTSTTALWIGLMAAGGAVVVGMVVVVGVMLKKTLGLTKEFKKISLKKRYADCRL